MTIRLKTLTSVLLLSTVGAVHATTLDLNLNNESFAATIEAAQPENRFNLSAGFITTEDNGDLFKASLFSTGKFNGNDNIHGGLGARFYHIDSHGDNAQALALGGFATFNLPVPELSVKADLHYAPSITATNDIDSVREFSLTLNYQLFENAQAYIGLRDIEVSVNNSDFSFEEGIHLGFKLEI